MFSLKKKNYKKYKFKKFLITGANGQDGKILSEIYHKKNLRFIV